jgi:CHAD domain-containing protein
MRVALRRLRSALSLFRRAARGADVDRVRADLTALARALGPARDWDVFLAGIARDVARLLPDEPAIGRMTAAARRQRGAAYASLATLLDAPAFQRTLLDLAHLAIVQPWRHGVAEHRPLLVDFARQALNRRLRRVLEAGDDLAELPAADLHAVRIQCKRLRYAAEFFAPLTPGRQSRRFLRRLAAVQERLGHLNDAAVAGELLAPIGGRGFAAGIVRGYLAARSAGGRAKAERSWKKFRRAEPFWS